MSEWISVKEKLPKPYQYVLCFCEKGVHHLDRYIICCVTENDEWNDVDYYDVSHISHWMPLPEPPKEKLK